MALPGRTTPAPGGIDDKYRYSHNGQEKDNDIFIGALSAEYWEYDSRTGRRWENDPLTYAWQSPYATFNNNPIYYSDISGLEGERPSSGGDRGSGTPSPAEPSTPKSTPSPNSGGQAPGPSNDHPGSGDYSSKLPEGGKDKGVPTNTIPSTPKAPMPTQTSKSSGASGIISYNTNVKVAYKNDYYSNSLKLKVFMDGATNAASSDMLFGIGRNDPRKYSDDPYIQQIYAIGQVAGDVLAIATADGEITAGEAGMFYAGGMAATGVGIAPAALTAVGSALVTVHGVATISYATAGMLKTAIILKSISHHNNNSKAADTGGGSEKFEKMGKQKGSSSEKMPDDVAKKLGIKNKKKFMDYLHKLKKAEKRGGADNYTWDELLEIGKEFLEINGNK